MNFGTWEVSIHESKEQQRRISTARKAETSPAVVDRENKTAEFKGSDKTPYTTTLESCTCTDFMRRVLPCKHIYRLALELDGGDVVQGVNKNEYAGLPGDIFALSVESQEMLYDMCSALTSGYTENRFMFERTEHATALLHGGFCVETVLTLDMLCALPVPKIKGILNMALPERGDLPKKTAQRKQCVAWLEANYESAHLAIKSKLIFLVCNEHTEKQKHTIKRRYEKKFTRVETDYGDGITSGYLKKLFVRAEYSTGKGVFNKCVLTHSLCRVPFDFLHRLYRRCLRFGSKK